MLKEQSNTQVDVIGKLSQKGVSISPAAFSDLLKKDKAGEKLLKHVAEALLELVKDECGMEWEDSYFVTTAGTDFTPKVTPTKNLKTGKKGYVMFDERRLEVEKKVEFFKDAQVEVIEFGTLLSKFSSNLYSGNREEFRSHVEEVLQRGVKFKCYLIDPSREGIFHYFTDRAIIQPVESEYASKFSLSVGRLKTIHKTLAEAGFASNLEVFSYAHFPYNYFLAVDGAQKNGKLLVSHYLYGITRAESPTLVIHRKDNPTLFKTYWDSLQALIKDAKMIIPEAKE